jgi:hypothetical protein
MSEYGILFVSVYNNQLHFVYQDIYNNIQDVWYDGSGVWSDRSSWNVRQINDPNDNAPTVPGNLFVSVFTNQQHFVYQDVNGNLQDVWYVGNVRNLQQINNGGVTNGPASIPTAGLFVSVYSDQQHFAYIDTNENMQDAWYDGSQSQWNLQQINNKPNATIQGEYVATDGPPVLTGPAPYVSVYENQQHFAYLDANSNIQDAWYDGGANPPKWNLQQINNGPNNASIPGEPIRTGGPPAYRLGNLFVSVFTNQQHFTYIDEWGKIHDAWSVKTVVL